MGQAARLPAPQALIPATVLHVVRNCGSVQPGGGLRLPLPKCPCCLHCMEGAQEGQASWSAWRVADGSYGLAQAGAGVSHVQEKVMSLGLQGPSGHGNGMMVPNNVPCPHSSQGRCRSASWAVSSCWQLCLAVPQRPHWPGAPPRAGFGAGPGSSVVEVSWPVSRGTQGAGGSKGPSYLACPEPQLCPCRRGAGRAKGGQSCRGPDRLGASGQAVLGPDLCHSPGAGENGPCEVRAGPWAAGWKAGQIGAGAAPYPQPGLPM